MMFQDMLKAILGPERIRKVKGMLQQNIKHFLKKKTLLWKTRNFRNGITEKSFFSYFQRSVFLIFEKNKNARFYVLFLVNKSMT